MWPHQQQQLQQQQVFLLIFVQHVPGVCRTRHLRQEVDCLRFNVQHLLLTNCPTQGNDWATWARKVASAVIGSESHVDPGVVLSHVCLGNASRNRQTPSVTGRNPFLVTKSWRVMKATALLRQPVVLLPVPVAQHVASLPCRLNCVSSWI